MTTVVEFGNTLLADLAHALTGKTHLGTDLLKTTLLATDSETFTHDLLSISAIELSSSSPKGASILM